MARLETFEITVRTGEHGKEELPQFAINGFPLDFEATEGNVESGSFFRAKGEPGSFPHTLVLVGPDIAPWDIASASITYYMEGQDPYTVQLGAVTLEPGMDLNLLYDRPLPTFSV